MRVPRVRFTLQWMMVAVAVVAVIIVARPVPSTERYKTVCPSPQIQGEVSCVDQQNERVTMTIGSDDGLVVGFELHLFRTKPRWQSLGKVRIVSTDLDQSVGQVFRGWTIREVPIRKRDKVSLYPPGL